MKSLINLLIGAPNVLLDELAKVAPDLVERGRVQVANARLMGQFTVTMGGAEIARRWSALETQLHDLSTRAPSEPPGATNPAERSSTALQVPAASPAATGHRPARSAKTPSGAVTSLALADYDTLAASQIVQRLGGLRPDELEAIRVYELAHRGRKTILGRVAQLQR